MVEQDNGDWAMAAARQFAESAENKGLKVPIEAVAEVFRSIETVDIDLAGIARVYSTEEAAEFFAKSPQWLYWGLTPREEGGGGLFYKQVTDPETGELLHDPDTGDPLMEPIEPDKHGKRGILRYDLDTIKAMGVSLYQRRTIDKEGLQEIVRKIHMARIGRWEPVPKKKTKSRTKTRGG